jgi:hypothetical protein
MYLPYQMRSSVKIDNSSYSCMQIYFRRPAGRSELARGEPASFPLVFNIIQPTAINSTTSMSHPLRIFTEDNAQ